MNKLKLNDNKNNEIMEGYFLEKNWFFKWKEYTDYDNNRFLLSDNNNEQEIKSKIKGKINQNIQSELFQKLVIKDFTKINFDSIKNDLLILINDKFLGHFEKNLEYQKNFKIKFKIENHKFIFEMQNHDKKSLCSIKNTLPIENNKCFRIANNLIELYIFQEQLKLRINKGKKDERENLILIDTKYLSYIKNKYSYNKICDSIKDKSIIKEYINQLNTIKKNDEYILNDILSGFNWEFFSDIYNVNINEIKENYELETKEIKLDNNINIKYFDNFELLDINIFNKLKIKEEIKNKISTTINEYYIDEKQILIKYENQDKKDIYMIGNIQANNIFASEYYIEIKDPLGLKTFLSNNKISDTLKGNSGDIININNKKIGKVYKINNLDKIEGHNITNLDKEIYDLFHNKNESKKQLNDDKNINKKIEEKLNLNQKKLVDENNILKDELNKYKREDQNLRNEINKFKEDNLKLKSELMNANKIIFNLNNIQQNYQENIKMINNLNELIQIKDKEINDLKIQLISTGNKNKLANYNDIFFVHFISKDEKISCGIKCLKTDTFSKVEEKFYEKYPEYRETNNQFLLRGKSILRDKKICEIFIKDSEMILFINT
jgi:hypothetical protein